MEHVLGAGEARRVDNGHLVAWTDKCAISATAGSGSILGRAFRNYSFWLALEHGIKWDVSSGFRLSGTNN